MSTNGSPQPANSLEIEALHYASGEMDGDAAGRFEASLSDSQEARDALVAAMQLLTAPATWAELRPDPHWRDRVRHRLLHKKKTAWGYLRPVAWMATGAVAASLTFVSLGRYHAPALPNPGLEAAKSPMPPSTEVIYSELSNAERMVRVMDEHAQKKHKVEEIRTQGWNEGPPPGVPRGPSM